MSFPDSVTLIPQMLRFKNPSMEDLDNIELVLSGLDRFFCTSLRWWKSGSFWRGFLLIFGADCCFLKSTTLGARVFNENNNNKFMTLDFLNWVVGDFYRWETEKDRKFSDIKEAIKQAKELVVAYRFMKEHYPVLEQLHTYYDH